MVLLRKLWQKITRSDGAVAVPEDYWRNLGGQVVGNINREEMLDCRQIDTYRAIFGIVSGLSVPRVADLGCNVSIMGVILRESGYSGEYVGVDANPNALRIAQQNLSRYPAPFQLTEGNLRRLDFGDNSFECIIMKDVLEHMEDFRPILREVLRITSKHAIIANFIPWTEGETVIRREAAGYYHNLYSRKDVYAFVREQGFDIISVISVLEKDARPNEVILLRRV